MNIKETFKDNQFMIDAFGDHFDQITNVSTTKEVAKPAPIDDVLKKLNIKTIIKPIAMDGNIVHDNSEVIFELSSLNSEKRNQYLKAYLLAQCLNPKASNAKWLHFAAQFTMPERIVKLALSQAISNVEGDDEIIKYAAKAIGVSEQSLIIRLDQLQLLNN